MRYMKWVGLFAVILLIVSCFLPWVIIPSKNIVVSGVESTGTNFGKPSYTHFVLSFFFIIFHFIPRLWAKRSNLLVVALNIAWAIRNYLLLGSCLLGECPQIKPGLYLLLLATVVIQVMTLLPKINIAESKK